MGEIDNNEASRIQRGVEEFARRAIYEHQPIERTLVEELYQATGALLIALKNGDDTQPYVEDTENALAAIDAVTGWEDRFHAAMERQLGGLSA